MSCRPSTSPDFIQSLPELPTLQDTRGFRIKRKPPPTLYDYPLDVIENMITSHPEDFIDLLPLAAPEEKPFSASTYSLPTTVRNSSLHLDYWNDDEWQVVAHPSPPFLTSEKEDSLEEHVADSPPVQRRRALTVPNTGYATPIISPTLPNSVEPLHLASTAMLVNPLRPFYQNSFPFVQPVPPNDFEQLMSSRPKSCSMDVRQPPSVPKKDSSAKALNPLAMSSLPTFSSSRISFDGDGRSLFGKKKDKASDEASFEEFWSEGFSDARTSIDDETSGFHKSRRPSGSKLNSKSKSKRQSQVRFSFSSTVRGAADFNEYAPPTREQLEEASNLFVISESGIRTRFGQLWRDQKTIVIFIRHFLCPLCQDYMISISRNISPDVLKNEGVKLVVVGNGHYDLIKPYRRIFRTPFEVYTDPTLETYVALGMTLCTVEKGPKAQYVRHGTIGGVGMVVANAIKTGMPVWKDHGKIAQLGGEFILGPGLECSFSHRMRFTRSHLPILDVVKEAGVDMVTPLNVMTRTTGKTFLGVNIEGEATWMGQRKRDLQAIITKGTDHKGGRKWDGSKGLCISSPISPPFSCSEATCPLEQVPEESD
ncbi:hypothetical protein PM082_001567 [Marasmius tenuissimus]|nr:hypothetical protein PM082_001567 [Marasmius tenuissimus]